MEVIKLWTLQIDHDYFQGGKVRRMDVQVSPEIRVLLMRRNLIWRRNSINEWCLSSFGDYSMDDMDVLELELLVEEPLLHQVTDFNWSLGMECYDVTVDVNDVQLVAKECMGKKTRMRTHSCFMRLSLPLSKIINEKAYPRSLTLSFQAVSRYWEYIFVPRQSQMQKALRLEDAHHYVRFGACEAFELMGHKTQKIRSLDKIPLRESYHQDVDLVLWEILSVNDVPKERILLRALPTPDLSLQLNIAPETIWRIIYY